MTLVLFQFEISKKAIQKSTPPISLADALAPFLYKCKKTTRLNPATILRRTAQ